MYEVILTQRALKDWKKIDKGTRDRIAVKLREYAEDPLRYARKLIDPRIGTYRFRIGEYRAISDIDDENMVILRIGHKKSIYR